MERGDDRMAQFDGFVLVLEIEAEGLLEVCESVVHRVALTRHVNFKTARNEEIAFVSDRGCEFHHASIREGTASEPWPKYPIARTSGIQAVSIHICIHFLIKNGRCRVLTVSIHRSGHATHQD